MCLVHVVFVDGILQVSSLNEKYCISTWFVHAKLFECRVYSVIRQEDVNGLAAIWLRDCARVLYRLSVRTCAISQPLPALTTILMMFL